MPADAVDYGYYRYTTDGGLTFSVKQDVTWGDNADAGFGVAVTTDAVMVSGPSLRPRRIVLQDPVSTRITTRVVGSSTADAWTNDAYTTTVKFRGLATGVTVQKIQNVGERIRKLRSIYPKPEPV